MRFSLTMVSRNAKVGPIPVATSSQDTCPPSCPLMGAGCYAEHGPLAMHWKKVALTFSEFLDKVRTIPRHQIWRYGQAGDLPGNGEEIDAGMMDELVVANRNRPVIAYTHRRPEVGDNLRILQKAQEGGFTVNLSADDLAEADELADTGLPVVTVLPIHYGRDKRHESITEWRDRFNYLPKTTPKGRRIAVCPATYADTNCAQCQLCAIADRDVIVGFPAHGTRKAIVNKRITSDDQSEFRSGSR